MKTSPLVSFVKFAALILCATTFHSAKADTFSSVADGVYNVNTTWGGASNPVSSGVPDDVTINNTVTITTASWASLDTIKFGGGNAGVLLLRNNNPTSFSLGTLDLTGGDSSIRASRATSGGTILQTLNASTVTMGNGKTLTVVNGLSITGAGSVANLTINGASTLTGTQTFNVGNNTTGLNILTLTGNVSEGSTGSAIVKSGSGSLVLNGVNTYTGNTTVNAGSLLLSDNAGLKFKIGSNGVNNAINGTGSLTLSGDFTFDLTTADATLGNSWNIVDVTDLSETFTASFTVVGFSSLGGGLWDLNNGVATYEFSQNTGNLVVTAVPEPGTYALLFGGLVLLVFLRRRKSLRA